MTLDTPETPCPDVLGKLTPAERSVLKAIGECGDIRAAAERLYLSPCTVQTHLHNIHEKLGVRSTMEAVVLFIKDTAQDQPPI